MVLGEEMMRYVQLILITILALVVAGCEKRGSDITYAKVLDPDFETIQVISDSKTLNELNQIWETGTTVDPSTECTFSHKIDVYRGENSTRWLYDPRGYATILRKRLMPIYKFEDSKWLRKLLIPQQKGPANSGSAVAPPE